MIQIYLFTLLLFLVSASISIRFARNRTSSLALFVPSMVQYFAWHCLLSGVLFPWQGMPTLKLVVIEIFALLLTVACNRLMDIKLDPLDKKTLFLILSLAFISTLDMTWLLHKNGFYFDGRESYISGLPVNADIERTIVLISRLIRGDRDWRYHAFFLQGGATYVEPFGPEFSGWQNSTGTFSAVAFLFYSVLFWAIAVLRKDLLRSKTAIFVIFTLVFSHAEVVYPLLNWIIDGKIGSSVTNTFSEFLLPIYAFRSFSAKAVSFIGPQHTTFLATFAVPLVYYLRSNGSFFSNPNLAALVWLVLSFLASPILFALGMSSLLPGHLLIYGRKDLVRSACWGLTVFVVALLAYRFSMGNWVHKVYFGNQGGSGLVIWPKSLLYNFRYYLPFTFFVASGVIAVATVVFAWQKAKAESLKALLNPILLSLPIGVVLFHLVISDTILEIQRHHAILLSLSCPLALILLYPKGISKMGIALAALALFLHLDFISAYGLTRNWLDKNISYKDYFEILNRKQSEGLQGGVVSAIYQYGAHLYPLALRYGESIPEPSYLWMANGLTPERSTTIEAYQKAGGTAFAQTGQHLSFARDLGMRFVLWGPVEEKLWGPPIRDQYLKNAKLVFNNSTVGLFSLDEPADSDQGAQLFDSIRPTANADFQSAPPPHELITPWLRKWFSVESFTYRKLRDHYRTEKDGYLIYEPWQNMYIAVLAADQELVEAPTIYLTAGSAQELEEKIKTALLKKTPIESYNDYQFQKLDRDHFVAVKRLWPIDRQRIDRGVEAPSWLELKSKMKRM